MGAKALIFDFDGTLVDSLPLIISIYNQLSSKYKYQKIKNEELEILRNKGPQEILKILNVPKIKIPFMAIDLKKAFQKELISVQLVKGIKETLLNLHKQGYILGILTSNGKENVENYLKLQKIDFIDFIFADVSIFGKGSSLKKALNKHKIKKEEAIYIGDEIRDIEAAKAVGIKIISVTWGINTKQALKSVSPDYLVDNPKEILSYLN